MNTNTLLKNLFVETKFGGNWTDNFFDLLPNESKTIVLITDKKITLKDLQFLSINDLILNH